MNTGQTVHDEQHLADLPDGAVIRWTAPPGRSAGAGATYIAEARTIAGQRRWATTTSQTLTSAQVLTTGRVTIIDIPQDVPLDGLDRHLAGIVTAQAEVAALTAQRGRAADRFAARIARAHAAGVSFQSIADALGISRQRVAVLARKAGD